MSIFFYNVRKVRQAAKVAISIFSDCTQWTNLVVKSKPRKLTTCYNIILPYRYFFKLKIACCLKKFKMSIIQTFLIQR